MRTVSIALAVLLISVAAHGTRVPEQVLLTEQVIEKLGFRLNVKVVSDYIDLKLEFPERIEPGWVASGTVVSFVVNGDHGRPILATRTDFKTSDKGRPVLVTFPVTPRDRDVGVDVVYLCVDVSGTICEPETVKHYGIVSVRSLLEPGNASSRLLHSQESRRRAFAAEPGR